MEIATVDESAEKVDGWKKWGQMCCAVIEIGLFGGIHFGWGSLVFVLKDEGLYANLCPRREMYYNETNSTSLFEDTTYHQRSSETSTGLIPSTAFSTTSTELSGNHINACRPQDDRMALCFAVATALFNITTAVTGHVNYKFGTRIYRLVGYFIFTSGALMMAFASVEVPWLTFPGLTMIGIGGFPLLVSNVQIANLFEKGRSTIVVCLNAAYMLSSGVQLFVKLLHENGVSRQTTYISIAILHSLTLICTFKFLPKTFIPTPEEAVLSSSSFVDVVKGKSDIQNDKPKQELDEKVNGNKHALFKCVKRPLFITHCVWFCVLQLKYLFFIGILNVYLDRTFEGAKDMVSFYTNIWLYIMICGAFPASFVAGSIYELQRTVHQNTRDKHSATYQALIPAVLPHAVGSLLFVLFSVLTLIPSTMVIYPTFILMTISRAFLYGLALAFLSVEFPSEYFGFLCGFMYIVGGLFGFLQYALFAWAESYLDGPLHADIALLALMSLSFFHPFYIWLTCKRSDRK